MRERDNSDQRTTVMILSGCGIHLTFDSEAEVGVTMPVDAKNMARSQGLTEDQRTFTLDKY